MLQQYPFALEFQGDYTHARTVCTRPSPAWEGPGYEAIGIDIIVTVSNNIYAIGTDVPQLGELLHGNPALIHSHGVEHALVTTKAQARKKEMEQYETKRATTMTTHLMGHMDVEDRAVKDTVGTEVVEDRAVEDTIGAEVVEDRAVEDTVGTEVVEEGDSGKGGTVVKGEGGLDEKGMAEGEVESESSDRNIEDSFSDDLFMQPTQRQYLTRQEKRRIRKEHGLV